MKTRDLLKSLLFFSGAIALTTACKVGGGGGGGGGGTKPSPTPKPSSTPSSSATPDPSSTPGGSATPQPSGSPPPLMTECPPLFTPKALPTPVKNGFGGNGSVQTWDGRVFVFAQYSHQVQNQAFLISTFRPQNIKTSGGVPIFTQGAFDPNWYTLEGDFAEGSGMTWHNGIGMHANQDFAENPFRSDGAGNARRDGDYMTYEVVIVTQYYYLENDNKDLKDQWLGKRRARIIIADPYTSNAHVQWAGFLEPFQQYATVSGKKIHGMEPTVTFDGRLVIYQGHPDNDNKIDNLMYTWNPTPNLATGWSEPKSITKMNSEKNVMIDGIPLHERFPIAKEPLKDGMGVVFKTTELFQGAYPWVTLDGTEIFFTATVAGIPDVNRARRGGASVIGRWTGYTRKHIDGPMNPDRNGMVPNPNSTLRLFVSGSGAFPSMWQPYRDIQKLPIPYIPIRPVMPIFGSNSEDYNEVPFDDYLDGNYALYLRLNEMITHDSNIDASKTADTSPNFNTGYLENGAKFPQEYNSVDKNEGAAGQAVYFSEKARIRVAKSASTQSFPNGLTVQMWVKRIVDMAQSGGNHYRYLIGKQGQFDMILEAGGLVSSTVIVNGQQRRLTFAGSPIPLNEWHHVAITYNPGDGAFRFYYDGRMTNEQVFGAGALASSLTDTFIGPNGIMPSAPFVPDGQAIFLLDDVAISNIPRSPQEMENANYRYPGATNYAPAIGLPRGLNPKELKITAWNPVSSNGIELGRKLFFDKRLSKNGDMSCATCHDPAKGFSDSFRVSKGFGNKELRRNSPTVVNRAFSTHQFWDGRASTLEDQALIPISSADEMNLPLAEAEARLNAIPGYVTLFNKAYGDDPSAALIGRALATFQRTILSGDSRVDRFESGDLGALNESEIRGRVVFHDKGRCVSCHNGSNYSDEQFHNTGFFCKPNDDGRSEITARPADKGRFKTPTLRDVALSAPYMHNGRVPTLEEMVNIYNVGGLSYTNRDPEMRPLGLTSQDKNDLVAFLRALNSNSIDVEQPSLP